MTAVTPGGRRPHGTRTSARRFVIYVLGIDVGTGGTRALVVDERGKPIASSTEGHVPFVSPKIGWVEQSPEDWRRACTIAVSGALAKPELRGNDVACVGFSGQMHGAVMLDENDQVVRPALIWCDVSALKRLASAVQLHPWPPLFPFAE